jgi:hypothetical protein
MGTIGDCYDNALIESSWGRMQTELLNRRRWRTRLELANAIFEYLEIFHNRQRRHSPLGMLTPVEFELKPTQAIAQPPATRLHTSRGTSADSRPVGMLEGYLREAFVFRSGRGSWAGRGCLGRRRGAEYLRRSAVVAPTTATAPRQSRPPLTRLLLQRSHLPRGRRACCRCRVRLARRSVRLH